MILPRLPKISKIKLPLDSVMIFDIDQETKILPSPLFNIEFNSKILGIEYIKSQYDHFFRLEIDDIFNINKVIKWTDLSIDLFKIFRAPTWDNVEKLVLKSYQLAAIYGYQNGAIAIALYSIGKDFIEEGYEKAFHNLLASSSYMLLPSIASYGGDTAKYTYATALTAHSLYNLYINYLDAFGSCDNEVKLLEEPLQ